MKGQTVACLMYIKGCTANNVMTTAGQQAYILIHLNIYIHMDKSFRLNLRGVDHVVLLSADESSRKPKIIKRENMEARKI